MNKFFKKLSFFFIGLIFLFCLFKIRYLIKINNLYPKFNTNVVAKNDGPLFIWGDSQTYKGLDLEVLKSEINRIVFSSAHEGGGVYDFIIFTEMVPQSSDVLIAISKPVQIRPKQLDANSSGISYSALRLLYNNNYSIEELLKIFRNNLLKIPNHIFSKNNTKYDAKDEFNINPEHFSLLEKLFETFKPYISDKQNLYIAGIKLLKQKNCNINLIEFPIHQSIYNRVKDSPVSVKTDSFSEEIIKIANCASKDTLYLNDSKNFYFDLTHLNEHGASKVTNFIGDRLEVGVPRAFTILNAVVD